MHIETTIRCSLFLAAIVGITQADISFAGDEGAGVATSCLRRSDIRSTKIVSDRNVLFITRDGTTYNNQLMRQCPGLIRNAVASFTYLNNGKLCSGSTFQVLYRASPSTNMQSYWDLVTQQRVTMQGPAFQPGPVCQIGVFGPISQDEVKALVATEDPKHSRRRTDRDAVKTEAVDATPAAR